MGLTHAAIVPLIGGEVVASMRAFGTAPSYILSYEPFLANEKHLVNYLSEQGHSVPYYLLDKEGAGPPKRLPKVDVVSTLCPCAGLSMLSNNRHADNPINDWMYRTATHILENVRPTVFWGENAPTFGSDLGRKVRENLRDIGNRNGYAMTVYRTKSILHGLGQIRDRTFYFFWRGSRTPILEYFNRPHERIEDTILNVRSNFQMEPINPKVPSRDDPYFRYMLECVMEGAKYRDFFDRRRDGKSGDMMCFIEEAGHTQRDMARWMGDNGYEREVEKCLRRARKQELGQGYMYRNTIVAKDYIGAFVSNYPFGLSHPHEDRYITYREAMTIMGLPQDFELLDPRRSVNHICQNVPVGTATDMCNEIVASLSGERPWVDSTYTFQWNPRREHQVLGEAVATLDGMFA